MENKQIIYSKKYENEQISLKKNNYIINNNKKQLMIILHQRLNIKI